MSVWSEQHWAMFFDLLDTSWPGELDPDAAPAYRVALDGTDPEQIVQGVRRLLHGGARFRPSVAEILAATRRDPSRPTFEEALHLIFARTGILSARPERGRVFHDDDENTRPWRSAGEKKRQAEREAIEQACRDAHPLVGAFVQRQGIDRLRYLELDDPEYGGARRHELQMAWQAHVEAFDGREVAVLASGGRVGLRQLDPLAALGVPAPAGALTTGLSPTEEEGPRDDDHHHA